MVLVHGHISDEFFVSYGIVQLFMIVSVIQWLLGIYAAINDTQSWLKVHFVSVKHKTDLLCCHNSGRRIVN